MKTVWIVLRTDGFICGAYSSEIKAERAAQKHEAKDEKEREEGGITGFYSFVVVEEIIDVPSIDPNH